MKRMTKVEKQLYEQWLTSIYANMVTICKDPDCTWEDYYINDIEGGENARIDFVKERMIKELEPIKNKVRTWWDRLP